jgi:hypothetical protein
LSAPSIEAKLLKRDIAKLIELGVSEKWLIEINITQKQARELLKVICYLKEMYPEPFRLLMRTKAK